MVQYINYKGEKYPVRISYYAIKKLKDEGKNIQLGVDDQSLASMDAEILEILLYHSLIAGAKAENKEMELPREEMEWVLDECMLEFIKLLPLFFPKAENEKNVESPAQ